MVKLIKQKKSKWVVGGEYNFHVFTIDAKFKMNLAWAQGFFNGVILFVVGWLEVKVQCLGGEPYHQIVVLR